MLTLLGDVGGDGVEVVPIKVEQLELCEPREIVWQPLHHVTHQ